MIDITTYRIRIGLFRQKVRTTSFKCDKEKVCDKSFKIGSLLKILLIFIVTSTATSTNGNKQHSRLLGQGVQNWVGSGLGWEKPLLWTQLLTLGANQTVNFKARYLHGNGKKRGIVNIHVNIRSLYNKVSEVKRLVQQEKPHILGISECELKKSHHSENKLKVPGYELLLPKSWQVHGKARVVVYIKKTLLYEQLSDLEHEDIQSIWLRAGFKSMKKIYFSHQYREHTNTIGNTMAAQRSALERMLVQWEEAVIYGNPGVPNEVHIAGDMNLDCLKGRWLEPSYALVTLARMVCQLLQQQQLHSVSGQSHQVSVQQCQE